MKLVYFLVPNNVSAFFFFFYLRLGVVSDGGQNISLCKNETLHISYSPHVGCSSAEKTQYKI